jgi:hypothetical protein
MIFQKVLKGIPGLSRDQAKSMVETQGILCNWWRQVNPLPEPEVTGRLTEENLIRHLSAYDQPDPNATGRPFGHLTPFISTTAGAVERDAMAGRNVWFSAFLTALFFATNDFATDGVIFYAYVNTLGRKSVAMREFAEETRELNLWTSFQPYHPEGEIVAKIHIPPPHLERAEGYSGQKALDDLRHGRWPAPSWTENNPGYVQPESLSNIREVLL